MKRLKSVAFSIVSPIGIFWVLLLLSYFYVDSVCEGVPFKGRRDDIEGELWLFRSTQVAMSQVPGGWRPNEDYSSEKTIVRYRFVLMPLLDFYVLYDTEDRMEMRIPAYE